MKRVLKFIRNTCDLISWIALVLGIIFVVVTSFEVIFITVDGYEHLTKLVKWYTSSFGVFLALQLCLYVWRRNLPVEHIEHWQR